MGNKQWLTYISKNTNRMVILAYTTGDYGTNQRDLDYERFKAFEGNGDEDFVKPNSIRYRDIEPVIIQPGDSLDRLEKAELAFTPEGKMIKNRYGEFEE